MPVKIRSRVTNLPDHSGAIEDGVREASMFASGAGFQHSQLIVPKSSGELQNSGIPPTEQPDGSIIWGYTAPHTLPVEFGSVPHWPPIEPLIKWARRNLTGGQGFGQQEITHWGSRSSDPESAAYAIQRKIAEEGTQPQPFVRPGFRVMKNVLRNSGFGRFIKSEVIRRR